MSGKQVLCERLEVMQKGQAERLFPMLEEVLAECGKAWSDLTAIGVCTGPGNFTGLRISVAAARGLSLSLGIPAVGVTKLEAMAYGTKGHAVSVLDARRERVYLQAFRDEKPLDVPQMLGISDIYGQLEQASVLRVMADEALDLAGAEPVENLVQAVGHIAAARYDEVQPRPAPLYLRPADAALPSDPPVVILP
jgi:tRNA threonylcarbamoyl adenosine modification protein YeaZ